MVWAELIGAVLIAVLVGLIFFYGFKSKGPWGTLWPFLLLLFVGIWLLAALSDPVGPIYWGIAWFDLFFFGILFALILTAATPTAMDRRRHREYYAASTREKEEDGPAAAVAIGLWFWIMILIFFMAAIFILASY